MPFLRRTNGSAEKISAGTVVSKAEQAKVKNTLVVDLNPGDLGSILLCKLSKDGCTALDSHIVTAFTKEKMLEAHRKVCYYIFHVLLFHHLTSPFLKLGFDPLMGDSKEQKASTQSGPRGQDRSN